MIDKLTKRAIKKLLKNHFGQKWIADTLNIALEDVKSTLPGCVIHNKTKIKKQEILKRKEERKKLADEIAAKVFKIHTENPYMRVKDKAKLAGITLGQYVRYQHQVLKLKQPHKPSLNKTQVGNHRRVVDTEKNREIREKYKEGIYTYTTLGKMYGLTRERIRQICGDLYAELKREHKTNTIIKDKTRYIKQKDFRKKVYERLGKILEIAKVQYKKPYLTLTELTTAYYNMYTKPNNEKLLKRSTISLWLSFSFTNRKQYQYENVNKILKVENLNRFANGYKVEKYESKDLPIVKNLFNKITDEKLVKELGLYENGREIRPIEELIYVFCIALDKYKKEKINSMLVYNAYNNLFIKTGKRNPITQNCFKVWLYRLRGLGLVDNKEGERGEWYLTEQALNNKDKYIDFVKKENMELK